MTAARGSRRVPSPGPDPDPAPGSVASRESDRARRLWAVAALTLAVAGAAVNLVRPLAPSLPPGLPPQATFDPGIVATIAAYRAPRLVLVPLITLLTVLVPVGIACWPRARGWVASRVGDREHAPLRAGVVAVLVTAVTWLATLPALIWLGVVQEGRWGFRTASVAAWTRDQLLVAGGRWLAVGLAVAVLFAARARWPRSWHHRSTVLATAVAGVLVVVHPVVLQPLLLTTEPLPDGPARQAVEEVLGASPAGDLPVVVADASRRTTRANALITGLGPTEQVVLYDNLLALPPSQVAAVVAHELAHHEHADLARGTLLTATAALIALTLLHRILASARVRRVVGPRSPADPRLAVVVIAVAAVLELIGTPVGNAVSRRAEAAADHRAFELGAEPAEIVRTVRTFVVQDLAAPDPGRLVHLVYGTHPIPVDRIRAAVAAAERDRAERDRAERDGAELPSIDRLREEERMLRHPGVGRDEAGAS